MTSPRAAAGLLGLLVLLSAPTPAVAAPADHATGRACPARGPVPAAALTTGLDCDLAGRTVVAGGARAVVPPPGQGVAARGIAADGSAQALTVVNDDGLVRAWTGAAAVTGARVGGRAPAKCADRAYRLYGRTHSWGHTLHWSYNKAGQLASMSRAEVVAAAKRGGKAMARGTNACGRDKRIDASIAFDGGTRARPTIGSSAGGATCRPGNEKNVIGWGSLGGDSLGWTCIYWDASGAIFGADIRLEPSSTLVIGVPQGCAGKLDLRSLLTHEWGHAFGLDHVSEAHHNLVMNHLIDSCSVRERTLGLGDYLGLKALYGVSG